MRNSNGNCSLRSTLPTVCELGARRPKNILRRERDVNKSQVCAELESSDDVESLRVADGLEQLLLELLLVLVLGQQEVVEARVRRRESALVDRVPADDKVEVAESLDRAAVGAGTEDEELLLHLEGELVDHLPQQRHRRVLLCVAIVILRHTLQGGKIEPLRGRG